MSKVKSPTEKKRIAYERDHYNRNGESNKGWRKAKPLKKAKARRAFRKASKDLLNVCVAYGDAVGVNAARKRASLKQRPVNDWGAIHLREFVAMRRVMEPTGPDNLSAIVGADQAYSAAGAELGRRSGSTVKSKTKQGWRLDSSEVTCGASELCISGRSSARESRIKDITGCEIELIHRPTGTKVMGEIPNGNYTRKQMQAHRAQLWLRLFRELEVQVARALRIPGR